MTQNEMYAALVVVALLAYKFGQAKAKPITGGVPYDPLAWLNGYQAA